MRGRAGRQARPQSAVKAAQGPRRVFRGLHRSSRVGGAGRQLRSPRGVWGGGCTRSVGAVSTRRQQPGLRSRGVKSLWALAVAPAGSAALGDVVGFGHGQAGGTGEPELVLSPSVQHRKQHVPPFPSQGVSPPGSTPARGIAAQVNFPHVENSPPEEAWGNVSSTLWEHRVPRASRRRSPYRLASYAALVKMPGDPRSLENRHKGVTLGERAGA